MANLPTIAQCAAVNAAHAKPIIMQGYSMLSMFITSLVTGAAGFGLGWYVKGRGVTGVQNDINNIKTDVSNLQAKFSETPVVA